MTWSAPSERIKSSLPVLSTPVTSAPYILVSWTANVPAPPAAPLIRTLCPCWTCPLSRIPCRAMTAACGMQVFPALRLDDDVGDLAALLVRHYLDDAAELGTVRRPRLEPDKTWFLQVALRSSLRP